MKTFPIILTCFMALSAGTYDGSYQLLDNILSLGAITYNTCKERDLEIVKIDIDLVGTGNIKQVVKMMSSDFKYVIFCAGEPTCIKDLNIKVIRIVPGGGLIEVAKDESTDATAEVIVNNPISGNYIIVVDAVEMKPGFTIGYFYLCVAHASPER
jgi:hypothetical protein